MFDNPEALYILKNINRQICCIKEQADTGPTAITFAPSTAQDAFGRLRTSSPLTLFDSSHRFDDNDLWATAASGGSATFNANQGLVDLTVSAGSPFSSNYVFRETIKVFAYQPGKSLLVLNTFVMNPAQTGMRQRVGYFSEVGGIGPTLITESNGFWLELADRTIVGEQVNTLSFVKASTVTGTIQYERIKQADWNGDKLDGTGPSGITLDITKAQILWMDLEWLGVGSVRMGFVIDGQFILCHTFQHANIITSTYIKTASLPLRYDITTTGSVSILGLGNGKNYQWRVVNGGVTTTGGAWLTAAADSSVEYNITATSAAGGRVLASGFVNSSNQGSPSINILKEALFANQLERDGLTGTPYEIVIEMAVQTTSGGEGAFASIDWEEISR